MLGQWAADAGAKGDERASNQYSLLLLGHHGLAHYYSFLQLGDHGLACYAPHAQPEEGHSHDGKQNNSIKYTGSVAPQIYATGFL